MRGWHWLSDPQSDFTWHKVPESDLIEHELTPDCLCGPYNDGESADGCSLWVHWSLDGRERNEHV